MTGGGREGARMQVDHGLRTTCGAARVLPEAHVVTADRRGRDRSAAFEQQRRVRFGHHEARSAVAHHEVHLIGPGER
jgi:hypothetical protein